MQLTETIGDVFTLDCPAFAHGVNVDGVMGAGVAAAVRVRWPEMYELYRGHCRHGRLRPGMVFPWQAPDGLWVYNLASQDRPGRHARTAWIVESVTKMCGHATEHGIERIATVRLGCGIGGLDWTDVRAALEQIDTPVHLVVARPA